MFDCIELNTFLTGFPLSLLFVCSVTLTRDPTDPILDRHHSI